jgi:hypothetical protein
MAQFRIAGLLPLLTLFISCEMRPLFPDKMAKLVCEIADYCSDADLVYDCEYERDDCQESRPEQRYDTVEDCTTSGSESIKEEMKDCENFHSSKARDCIDRLEKLKDQCSAYDYDGDWRGEADRLLNFEGDCEGVYSKCD